MKLIVISNSRKTEEETRLVTQLFECGLDTLHLRKPKLSTKELKEFILQIPVHFHNRIIIHSHHDLALRFNLKGVHLTKSHKKRKYKTWLMLKLLKMRKPHLTLTTSHSNLASLFENEGIFNYVFLSPVFDTLTHKFQSGFTEHSLKKAIEKCNQQVIARGGVDSHCLQKAHEIGFSGVALYSVIWKSKNPVDEFNRVVERFNALKIPVE